ncbi:DNA helicase II, partial [Haemophilus influenzae]
YGQRVRKAILWASILPLMN